MIRSTADIFSSADQSPCQTAAVNGWLGRAARAQAKTFGKRA